MSEWEKRLEQPSVPLVAKGPPGPPKIVEIEKKYSAIEGSIFFIKTHISIYSNSSNITYKIIPKKCNIFLQNKLLAVTYTSKEILPLHFHFIKEPPKLLKVADILSLLMVIITT